jgi:N-acetylglucosamine-6-phosphate deacetylase
MQQVLTASKLVNGNSVIDDPVVVVAEGRIASLSSKTSSELPAGERHDFPGATLSQAFFDVHIHGAAGHDVMEATPEALTVMGRFLAAHGTGRYLATTVTAPVEATLKSLAGLAKLIAAGTAAGSGEAMAWPVGIHLEGPFLSHSKRGVHPPDLLLEPDIALFDRLFEAAEGQIRLITLAPELPGAVEFAAHATARGVRVSVGHSNATAAETRAVIAAGAVSATHTFNAMRALDHREPGILGVVLTTDDLFAELICDGIHNTPEMVKIWSRCKGSERAILITDAMSATGMPNGEYHLGGFAVQVADGRATANGVLAGSVLTLDRSLKNYVEFTNEPVERALPLMTANPAAMTGLGAAELTVGDAANLVAVDGAGKLIASFVNGVQATCGGADALARHGA